MVSIRSVIFYSFQSFAGLLRNPSSSMDHRWRVAFLDQRASDDLFRTEPSVKLLQASIAHLGYSDQIGHSTDTFQTALAKMLNNFSARPDTPIDAISCLRATLQVLVIYSITSGDSSWVQFPEAEQIEEEGRDLGETILSIAAIPKPSSKYEHDSIDKCRWHALLHGRKGDMEQQRSSLILTLDEIARKLPLGKQFVHYNPANSKHCSNAADLLQRLTPRFRLVGEALCLTLHPIPSACMEDDTRVDEKQRLLSG